MKDNLTEIVCVLDRSGSMSSIKQDAIGGFNEFLKAQKELDGEANMTVVLFDDEYILLNDREDIKTVNELNDKTFVPRGLTALNDAIGRTIRDIGNKLAKINEEDRPSKVIFVILTDGQENTSNRYSRSDVHEMVNHQKEKYNWEFIFLAVNQDAVVTGARIGIDSDSTLSFNANSRGIMDASNVINKAVSNFRNDGSYASLNSYSDINTINILSKTTDGLITDFENQVKTAFNIGDVQSGSTPDYNVSNMYTKSHAKK